MPHTPTDDTPTDDTPADSGSTEGPDEVAVDGQTGPATVARHTPGPDALRPATLAEFGGQPHVAREIGIILGAARERGDLPDHLLFAGPPGLGKTSLANIVAGECGLGFVASSGPVLDKPAQLISLITTLAGPSVVFIDEIHRLPTQVEELLYPAMEDGVLDIVIGEGARARAVRLTLQPFVLVGATTQVGLLSAPLRDRFGFIAKLRLYDTDELAKIVARSARMLGMDLTGDAAHEIASRSRGTPRVANSLLRRVRDYASSVGKALIDGRVAADGLNAFGVDRLGLDRAAREILETLIDTFDGGPTGLTTLANAVGEASSTVEEVYEPHLLRTGLITRTPRGRVATIRAYEHLGLTPTATALAHAQADTGSDDTPPAQPTFAFDKLTDL